jgi:hypothetical protein
MNAEIKEPFPIAKTIPIKTAGEKYTEAWLQDQICDNPSILTLGDLDFVTREKVQWKQGRLDILLKDTAEEKMFEVEVMLGETDEKHIIHTIEYWDNEKRKYPLRQHFAVLVAESFETRFFNIIHLFSKSIPLIAVQVKMVEVNGVKSLPFSKIIDTYQEPEETDEPTVPYGEDEWKKDAPWTLEAANTLVNILKPVFPNGKLHCVKHYIAIEVDGENRIWIHKRSNPKSLFNFWFTDKLLPKALELLDKAEIVSTTTKNQEILLTMDSKSLKTHESTIIELCKVFKTSWEE